MRQKRLNNNRSLNAILGRQDHRFSHHFPVWYPPEEGDEVFQTDDQVELAHYRGNMEAGDGNDVYTFFRAGISVHETLNSVHRLAEAKPAQNLLKQ